MASSNLQIFKCGDCSAEVEVIHGGGGTLICCGKPMELQAENTTDAAQEKHVPVIEPVEGGVKVTVGSVAHPMDEGHSIKWIEIIAAGKVQRQLLEPGARPEAVFSTDADQITARAYCNLHGLWQNS